MKSKVYFTKEITPEKVVEMYHALGVELPGRVAVKLHSGEKGNQNFLRPAFWRPMIEAVNGTNSATTAERSFVFLPNGTYDLGQTVLTAVSGKNISFIGESQEGVVVKNAPERETEGIGTTAVFLLTGQNLYFQDITLKNELDYYGALGAGQAGGRAVCIQDKGNRSVFKNVTLLSYQDTYYSNNDAMKSYWEDSDIHGTVDFICGGGDVRFVNTTLSLEPREANGTGGRTITAPTTTTQFGYVFDNCRVADLANGKGDWNFGRTWQNSPICVYLNTTLDDNAKNTLVKSRWTQKGMNSKDPKVFGEYGTKDLAGNDITPASNIINSHGGSFQTILTAEEAAAYTYEKMFTTWDPAALTVQMTAPANVKIDGGQLTWDAVEGAAKYLIERDGVFVALADAPGYAIDGEGNYTVRAANAQGGFGLPSEAATTAIKTINSTEARVVSTAIYSVDGMRQNQLQRGINIVVKTLDDGQVMTSTSASRSSSLCIRMDLPVRRIWQMKYGRMIGGFTISTILLTSAGILCTQVTTASMSFR